jgi:TPR repeat protein
MNSLMASCRKQLHFLSIALVAATAILLLVACTEKTEEGNPAEKIVSVVMTDDKISQWQKEAQQGDPDAQYNLAYLYENGIGVPKDEAKALEWYQKAADQGHSSAKTNLDAMSQAK